MHSYIFINMIFRISSVIMERKPNPRQFRRRRPTAKKCEYVRRGRKGVVTYNQGRSIAVLRQGFNG